MKLDSGYLEEIRKRRKESKIYKEFQLVGLEIADMLGDQKNIAIYMRLAKNGNKSLLFSIAKDVSERKGIKNKLAYFMKVLQKEGTKRVVQKKQKPKPILSHSKKYLRTKVHNKQGRLFIKVSKKKK